MALRCRFLFIILVGLVLLAGVPPCCRSDSRAQAARGVADALPFRPGEKHTYELRWGVIPAGLAELEVLPEVVLDGVPAWHFRLSVRTNDFVDVIYKVRDRIESFAQLSLQESLLYRKSQREGHSVRDEEVLFDNAQGCATYSNHGKAAPPISLMAGTIDPLTAVFFIRSQPLREGLEIVRPITDGKKNVTGVARVLGRERVEVNGVMYDAFRVEPDLRDVGGVFEKSDKSRITLWFSADERQLLLKIEGKVVVGAFTGTLAETAGLGMAKMD